MNGKSDEIREAESIISYCSPTSILLYSSCSFIQEIVTVPSDIFVHFSRFSLRIVSEGKRVSEPSANYKFCLAKSYFLLHVITTTKLADSIQEKQVPLRVDLETFIVTPLLSVLLSETSLQRISRDEPLFFPHLRQNLLKPIYALYAV